MRVDKRQLCHVSVQDLMRASALSVDAKLGFICCAGSTRSFQGVHVMTSWLLLS